MSTPEIRTSRPLWRRMLASAGRTALTLGVVGLSVGLGVAGYDALSARAAASVTADPAPLSVVAPSLLRVDPEVTLSRTFTGQFEAAQDTALGFEEGGTLAEVLVREGDRVTAGAVLARTDTRLLEAERRRLAANRAALEAQAELARRTNDRQAALLAEGHVAQQRLDETSLQLARLEASLAEIDAALTGVEVRLSKAEIRAPFAGRIGARLLDAGAVAAPGAPVVTLLEDAPPRFRVALDPELAARLAPGTQSWIESGGRRLPATLSQLAPELDPTTRSRIAYFDLAEGTQAPPARTTGDLVLLDTRADSGAWVPVSALRQGPRGSWTLLTLDRAGDGTARVTTEAAEVLHVDAERVFVRGSFRDGTPYLPAGIHRVVPGETVRLAEGK